MDTLFVSSTLEIERESINWRWMQGSVGITSSGLYYPQANYLVNEPKVMGDYARKNFPMDGFLKKFGKRLCFDFLSDANLTLLKSECFLLCIKASCVYLRIGRCKAKPNS